MFAFRHNNIHLMWLLREFVVIYNQYTRRFRLSPCNVYLLWFDSIVVKARTETSQKDVEKNGGNGKGEDDGRWRGR